MKFCAPFYISTTCFLVLVYVEKHAMAHDARHTSERAGKLLIFSTKRVARIKNVLLAFWAWSHERDALRYDLTHHDAAHTALTVVLGVSPRFYSVHALPYSFWRG